MPQSARPTQDAPRLARPGAAARPTPASWQVACPAQPDHPHTLTLTPRGTRFVLHCTRGCPGDALLAALRLLPPAPVPSPPDAEAAHAPPPRPADDATAAAHAAATAADAAPLLAAALAHAKLGWRVYHARPRSKRPQWTGYKLSATTDQATLAAWWTRWPDANPMALIPPGWAVLDVDPRHDGLATLLALQHRHAPLPPTWTVVTRHDGFHLYYHLPPHVALAQRTVLGPGLDLLGPHSPLTLPGFVHANGHVNAWHVSGHPASGPPAVLPAWLHPAGDPRRGKALDTLDPRVPLTPAPPGTPWPTPFARPGEAPRHTPAPGDVPGEAPRHTPAPGDVPEAAPRHTPAPGDVPGETPRHTPTPPTPHTLNPSDTPPCASMGAGTELLATPIVLDTPLTGPAVAAFLRDYALTCLAYLATLHGRTPPRLGATFLAWFRAEDHPSAAFLPATPTHPHVLYFDHGDRTNADQPRPGQTLPSVYYRLLNGDWPPTLKPASYLMWGVRLLVDAGVLQAPQGAFPPLPEGAPGAAHHAYRGFQSLWRVHALLPAAHGDLPFTEGFCATWCPLPARLAHHGLLWLLGRGFLLVHRWKQRLAYYLQGPKRLIARLRFTPLATSHHAAALANHAAHTALQRVAPPPDQPASPTACPTCDQDGYRRLDDGCEWCLLLVPAQARLDVLRRQAGTTPRE